MQTKELVFEMVTMCSLRPHADAESSVDDAFNNIYRYLDDI